MDGKFVTDEVYSDDKTITIGDIIDAYKKKIDNLGKNDAD
jgi:hypothetical protein